MPHPLTLILREKLRARPNPERAERAAAYMKVALPFLGLSLPEVRRIASASFRERPIERFADYQAFLKDAFYDAEYQEERYAVLAVASEKKCLPFQAAPSLPLYKRMILAAEWWDIVDDLSNRVGTALRAEPEPVSKTLRSWAQNENIWLRRTAIICQNKFKARTDLELLYDCIEPSLDRKDFFLRKGIGWALRELAKHNPTEVRRYVRANSERLSPLSRREAMKHLGE